MTAMKCMDVVVMKPMHFPIDPKYRSLPFMEDHVLFFREILLIPQRLPIVPMNRAESHMKLWT
jgi:hypothetical protein